jgi:hypothetical protein
MTYLYTLTTFSNIRPRALTRNSIDVDDKGEWVETVQDQQAKIISPAVDDHELMLCSSTTAGGGFDFFVMLCVFGLMLR